MKHIKAHHAKLQNLEPSDCARLISFSDGIFTIAITLCILEIVQPELGHLIATQGFSKVLNDLLPRIFGILATFVIVALYWLGHHRIFAVIKKNSPTLTRLNLGFLLLISFMPFAVKVSGAASDDMAATIFYSAYMGLTGIMLGLIWRHASQNHLLDHALVDSFAVRYNTARTVIAPLFFFAAIPVALISPSYARILWFGTFFTVRIVRFFIREPVEGRD